MNQIYRQLCEASLQKGPVTLQRPLWPIILELQQVQQHLLVRLLQRLSHLLR